MPVAATDISPDINTAIYSSCKWWLTFCALIGIAGAFVGSYLFALIGFSVGSGLIGIVMTATAGAVVLLFIASLLRKLQ
jgi:uncharacterized membrane protein YeaQ/YmgE (transglycosylase-associated protein family)